MGAAINTANASGEANTITFETGTYTLTAVGVDPTSLQFGPAGVPAIRASGARVGSRLEPLEGK